MGSDSTVVSVLDLKTVLVLWTSPWMHVAGGVSTIEKSQRKFLISRCRKFEFNPDYSSIFSSLGGTMDLG